MINDRVFSDCIMKTKFYTIIKKLGYTNAQKDDRTDLHLFYAIIIWRVGRSNCIVIETTRQPKAKVWKPDQ